MGRMAHLCVGPCARIRPCVGFPLRVVRAQSVWSLSFIICVTLGEMPHQLASLRLRVFIISPAPSNLCQAENRYKQDILEEPTGLSQRA